MSTNSQKAESESGAEEVLSVQLSRGARGFGFSIRGGREFQNMPLFVLKIAEGGPLQLLKVNFLSRIFFFNQIKYVWIWIKYIFIKTFGCLWWTGSFFILFQLIILIHFNIFYIISTIVYSASNKVIIVDYVNIFMWLEIYLFHIK